MKKLTFLFVLASLFFIPTWNKSYAHIIRNNDKKAFLFDPRTLKWIAYAHNGQIIRTGRGSGGQNYCKDIGRSCRTAVGIFKIYSKRGANCKSSKYPVGNPGAKMPYCMFFYKGYAIHGSNNVPNRNASHGCIRVPIDSARWLSNNFLTIGTKVIVRPY